MKLTISSLGNQKVLEGIKISCIGKSGKTFEGKTDAKGKLEFQLTEKDYSLLALDPSGIHKTENINYYNKKRDNKEITVYLSYNFDFEKKLIDQKTFVREADSSFKNPECAGNNSVVAQYPGGLAEMMKFMMYNLIYPQECMEKGVTGKVYLSFIIEADGSVSTIQIKKGVSKALDTEAIRLVSYFPNFIPATCDGQAVRFLFTLPINFQLE